ncbi:MULTISPECIES: DUF2231 domain-containing protein [unclassified Sinorhizobium]|uniref:DUF2231 domain-containing protein n=1 Tax=unclassified Sinorhizobium TaxID=2613772 RepID=UPI0035242B5C
MTYSSTQPILLSKPPLRAIPMHFAAACFAGVLLTDIAYWMTAEMTWTNFSAWLLTAGLLLSGVAGVAGIVDIARGRLVLRTGVGWLYMLCSVAIFVLAFLNALFHSRDAWTSVVPTGLTLSAIVVVLMLVNAVLGRLVERRRVGGRVQ